MKKFVFVVTIIYLFSTTPVFSWNSVAHRIVAQIAYDHLTRHAKITCNGYNRNVDHGYMAKSLVNASVWLDTIRAKTHAYDALHFIDIPFSTDGTPLPAVPAVNAVSAVENAERDLSNPAISAAKKGLALRILLHVVGDIHQPLHATTRVSRQYPEGDRGGNRVVLPHNKVAKNLHAWWDKGAGMFAGKRRYGQAWIRQKAAAFEKRWPCNLTTVDLNPMHWAQESRVLAMQKVYALPVDAQYQRIAQQIVEQRIALAGCRLAGVLNNIAPVIR